MRTKSTKQQYLDFSGKSRLKVVNEYREKYKIISSAPGGLDNNPQLVSLVHQDLAKMLSQSKRGRKSQYGFTLRKSRNWPTSLPAMAAVRTRAKGVESKAPIES